MARDTFFDYFRTKRAEDVPYRFGLEQPTNMDWLRAAGATPAWATNQPSWRAAAGGGAAGAPLPTALAERLTAASMNPAEQQRLRRLFTSPSINTLEAKRLFGAGFGRTPPAAPPPPAVQAAQIRAEAGRDVQEMKGEQRLAEIPLLQQGKRDLSILDATQRMAYLTARQKGDVALAEKTYGLARENALAVGGQRGDQAMTQLMYEKTQDFAQTMAKQALTGEQAIQQIQLKGEQDIRKAKLEGNIQTARALKEITATAMANVWATTYKNRPMPAALIQSMQSLGEDFPVETPPAPTAGPAPVAPQAPKQAPPQAQPAAPLKPSDVRIIKGPRGPEFEGGTSPQKIAVAEDTFNQLENTLKTRKDLTPADRTYFEDIRDHYFILLFRNTPEGRKLVKKHYGVEE